MAKYDTETMTQHSPKEEDKKQLMTDALAKLKKCFPQTKLLANGEVVVHIKGNQWFNLSTCKSSQEVSYKVLEYFSRGAYKTEPYRNRSDLTKKFHKYMLDGINEYLNTDFTEEDMELIYGKLGNGVNRSLTEEFFNSQFDMELLQTPKMQR